MAREESGAGTVIVAFVLGAITGAAVALLMAPASGEEVRRIISDKAREQAGQGRDIWNRQRDHLANAFEKGREAYQQARGGAQPSGAPGAPGAEGM